MRLKTLKDLQELKIKCIDADKDNKEYIQGLTDSIRWIKQEAVKWLNSEKIKHMNGMDAILVFCDIEEKDLDANLGVKE